MASITQEIRIELARHESVALGKLRGQGVHCLGGEIWLTIDGERDDVILRAGEGRAVASSAPVVVSAFVPATLRVSPLAAGDAAPRRMLDALRDAFRSRLFHFSHR